MEKLILEDSGVAAGFEVLKKNIVWLPQVG